jgi:hypothetical protein
VRDAIAVARAMRLALPDDVIAIATGEISVEGEPVTLALGLLLEGTVGVLAKEAMQLLFAGVTTQARPRGVIRVDERTASLIEPEDLVKIGTSMYVGAA